MPLILGANSVSGYTVKNSLRFNQPSSDNLTRTPSSTTNRRTFTLSFWLKRASLASGNKCPFAVGNSSVSILDADWFVLMIHGSTSTLRLIQYNNTIFATNRIFRDISAWYHIVVAVDTTQATASNRVKLYINGTQETSYSSSADPSLNYDFKVNTTTQHMIGREDGNGSVYFDGYLSEYNFIDGQQLTPTSFGETDTDTGIWKPKAYTGTYGTNGFYLKFANSASLGTDSSGNGNTFTVNNLTSVDQSTDTPTNNFATFNPLDKNTSITTSEGNLKITGTNDCKTTIGVSKGKWYCETKVTAVGATVLTGITFSSVDGSNHSAVDAKRIIYQETGYIYREATGNGSVNTGTTYTTSDIIGLALDCDNGTMKFYKNGTLIHTETNSVISGNEQMFYTYLGSSATVEMNFGNPSYSANSYTDGAGYGNFSYAVPSGYYSLNTKNLATFG